MLPFLKEVRTRHINLLCITQFAKSVGGSSKVDFRVSSKETGLKGVFSEDFGQVVERGRWGLGDCPEPSQRVMGERDCGSFGWGDVPTAAAKVDLVISVDPPFQMEGQMQVQQGCRRTGPRGRAIFLQGLLPGRIGAQARWCGRRWRLAVSTLARKVSMRFTWTCFSSISNQSGRASTISSFRKPTKPE